MALVPALRYVLHVLVYEVGMRFTVCKRGRAPSVFVFFFFNAHPSLHLPSTQPVARAVLATPAPKARRPPSDARERRVQKFCESAWKV